MFMYFIKVTVYTCTYPSISFFTTMCLPYFVHAQDSKSVPLSLWWNELLMKLMNINMTKYIVLPYI